MYTVVSLCTPKLTKKYQAAFSVGFQHPRFIVRGKIFFKSLLLNEHAISISVSYKKLCIYIVSYIVKYRVDHQKCYLGSLIRLVSISCFNCKVTPTNNTDYSCHKLSCRICSYIGVYIMPYLATSCNCFRKHTHTPQTHTHTHTHTHIHTHTYAYTQNDH